LYCAPKNWWIDLISWQINFAGLHARLRSGEAMISWFLSIRQRNRKENRNGRNNQGKRSGRIKEHTRALEREKS